MNAPPIRESWKLDPTGKLISLPWTLWLQQLTSDTRDVVIDLATKGLVLKDTQSPAHYWRLSVDNTGVLLTDDLGTVKP